MRGGVRPAGVVLRLALATLLPLGAFALAACEDSMSAGVADESLTSIEAQAVTYGMSSFLTTEGIRSGSVFADTSFHYQDSTVVRMYGVQSTIFNEQGRELAMVRADSGRLNQRTEQMTAWGDVEVSLPGRNCRIFTSEIHYDPPTQQIRSDAPVRFEEGGRVTTGAAFASDLRFERFRISSPVGPANICRDGAGGF